MGIPIQRGPLSPNDLQYYAPRKLRDSGNDLPSIQPAPKFDGSRDARASDDWKTDAVGSHPNALQARPHINNVDHEKHSRRFFRAKTLGLTAAAATAGIIAGVAFLGWQSGPRPTQQGPEVPFAARLETAIAVEPQLIVRAPTSQTPAAPANNAAVAEAPKQTATSNATAAEAPRHIDPKEVTALLRRAEELMSTGDLAAGRLLLERVAETKNARAAFQLATTYDPNVIRKYGSNSAAANSTLAQFWYQRAKDWGSPDAARLSEALTNRNQ